MSTSIRLAAPSDIPVLVGLMREFYGEANYALESKWASDVFSALLQDSARGMVWIAFDAERPAGYAVLTFRFSMEFGGVDGFIDDLFVRSPCRRRGIGGALLGELFSEAGRRTLLAVHVETSESNLAAVALYATQGLQDRKRLLLTKRLTARTESWLHDPAAPPGSPDTR